MSLNIKNERTHELVRRLAELTGSSQTSAVEDAVQRRLDELLAAGPKVQQETRGRRMRLDRLVADIHAEMTEADRDALRRAEAQMYDDAGLPS